MTVSELIELLNGHDPNALVATLVAQESGWVIDIETAPILDVTASINDTGSTSMVWLTAIGELDHPAPALISWPCPCGDVMVIDQRSSWPSDHDGH